MSASFLEIFPIATLLNFDEEAYLRANPDVQDAVRNGRLQSALSHLTLFGLKEQRRLDKSEAHELKALKSEKKSRIRQILRDDMPFTEDEGCFDFLTPSLRDEFSIIDTHAVSSNDYDSDFLGLIDRNKEGLVLDCGAGSRKYYYPHVVNFEIAKYPSTDVLGVGETLPFKDNSFDAVISLTVLEHVKDPWRCVAEILRVLKPGGEIICCVPFLQPFHGYPHHYYNMTGQGLKNLFGDRVTVNRHEVPASLFPIWSLNWILNSWCDGLSPESKEKFLEMTVRDLVKNPIDYLNHDFVTQLSPTKNFELASGTVLHGTKK
ncbi:MAG: class I SAM-dependent methyltransferase [Crocinitomicaceae bacterium]|nr:MAG: class I SAM-dependent methyltransferase [Crocinitomicaceae bacterium]